ncbi:MAG: sigma-54-dependent Fis family transcriptional regulator, partial [Boseongicola sp. SB0675_bin_26]|nr:sigma-54-dependent Fis family transcriptional regulator [Boseongicola sp. SB0675_bin_26]
ACKALRSQLDKVTKSNGRVMLTGPSGSGKEIAARYIHANSDRANGPFVSVSSASIAPERMEEVLFGRESAERGIEQGLLEEAHGGVVFFDEVADMPPGTQSKILRVLTEQQFQRVGGTDKVRVDLRVVSSTTRDLEAEVEAGNFREELFHRLNVVPITVPDLADRGDDIPELARHFIASLNKSQGLPLRNLADDAVAMLQSMAWPGNVRQLKNTIEKVLILGADKGEITATEVEGENRAKAKDSGKAVLSGNFTNMPLRQAREIFEREYLNTQLNRFGGNISRAAKFVGMERSALHRKLKSLNVMASSRNVAAAEGSAPGEAEETV